MSRKRSPLVTPADASAVREALIAAFHEGALYGGWNRVGREQPAALFADNWLLRQAALAPVVPEPARTEGEVWPLEPLDMDDHGQPIDWTDADEAYHRAKASAAALHPAAVPAAGVEEAGDLLPCPFCGGEAEIINIKEGENEGGSCVACTRCQASSNVEFERKENFVSNWNSRAALRDRTAARPSEGEAKARRLLQRIIDGREVMREGGHTEIESLPADEVEALVEQALGALGQPTTGKDGMDG